MREVEHREGTNALVCVAIALPLVLHILVVHLPFLNRAFGTVPLSGLDWPTCVAIASRVLWLDEAKKLIVRHVLRRRNAHERPGETPWPAG